MCEEQFCVAVRPSSTYKGGGTIAVKLVYIVLASTILLHNIWKIAAIAMSCSSLFAVSKEMLCMCP
jgi:hypothetical protein